MRAHRDILGSIALLAAVGLLYRKAARLWWTYDDAYLLHIAVVHSAREHFVGSAIWRSMPQRLFTPLLTASFDSELSLFGPEPRWFYVVQLALVAAVALLIFSAARFWVSSGGALTAAAVSILGTPICSLAAELMLVHYLESLVLAAAATVVFVIADRRVGRSIPFSSCSAIFYLGAMLAKEIAVPLPLIPFVLSRRRLRGRIGIITPHAAAVCVYALWRRRELGEWLGGYGWTIRANEIGSVAAAAPRAIIQELSAGRIAGIALLLILFAGVVLTVRSMRHLAIVVLVIVVTVAPILPMAKRIEPRFLVVPWIAAALLSCAGWTHFHRRIVRASVYTVLILLSIVVNRAAWGFEYRRSERMSAEGRYFLRLAAGDALRDPAIPPAAMGETRWLKEEYLHGPRGATWFYDDLYLCRPGAPERVFSYVPSMREVMRVQNIDRLCAAYLRSVRPEAPLSVSFHHKDESLFWSFGPYDRGTYSVLIGDGIQAFEVPRTDGFRLPGVNSIALRVRYESPDHWVTYTPDLALDFVRRPSFVWRR